MRTPKHRLDLRKLRIRSKISKVSDRKRLSVFRSNQHIYAQIIDDKTSSTLVHASTLDKDLRKHNKSNCNIEMAKRIGQKVAEKAKEAGIVKVVFDTGGRKYHGIIKALAEAAREKLEF